MTTLAIMLAEIQADTERTSASDVTAMRAKINAAIRQYQPKRFWFNESRSVTFNTVASTAVYTFVTIGTEFYKIDGAFLTDGSEITELERVNYTEIEPGQSTPTEAAPFAYAYVAKSIRLYDVPDAIYAVRLTGHIKIAAPASDAEADNIWMTEAYDLIMCRAKAELYAHRWEDPANAQIMRAAEGDALQRLFGATHDKVALGYLEATEF
jgi:hypothetical protein